MQSYKRTPNIFTLVQKVKISSWGTQITYLLKNLTLAPRGIRLNFCIQNALIVVDMKPLYSNATRIAFRGKHAFCMGSR